MADLTAPSNWYLDIEVPSILRRRDGQNRPTPLQVPELVPKPSDPRSFEAAAGSSSRPRSTGTLKARISGFRSAAAATTTAPSTAAATTTVVDADLAQLERQVAELRRERDDLLATAIPLRAEVAALRSDREELVALQSEVEILRRRKRSLEDAMAGRPRPADQRKPGNDGHQRFHDS